MNAAPEHKADRGSKNATLEHKADRESKNAAPEHKADRESKSETSYLNAANPLLCPVPKGTKGTGNGGLARHEEHRRLQ